MSELRQYLGNQNVQTYLNNVIAAAEGTAKASDPYRVLFGGGMFDSTGAHPNVRQRFRQTDGKENETTAAGKYQFLKSTWDDVSSKLGLKDFGQESQDLAAIELLRRNGSLEDVVKGNFDAAVQKDGKTWASLPSSPYAQPKRSNDFIKQSLGQGASAGDSSGAADAPADRPLPNLIRGLEKAKAAGDAEAVAWFTEQTKPKLENALLKARAAQDTEASEFFRKKRSELGVAPTFAELGAKIYKRVEGKEFTGTPAEAEEYAKSFEGWKNNLFSQGKKALAVGKWDEEGQIAYLDLEDKYQDEVGLIEGIGRGALPVAADPTTWAGLGFGKLIAKTGQTATRAAIRKGLEQSLAKRIAQSTATKAGAEGAVYGAATNAIGQAGRVEAGGQDSIDGTQVAGAAGLGTVVGAGAGKLFDRLSGQSAIEKLARKAGSEEGLRIDAEAIQELAKIRDNPNFRGQGLRTEQINQVGTEAVDTAKAALDKIGAKGISEAGADPNQLYGALAKWKKADAEALRGTEIGDAVADAITKAQRVRSLTAEQEAAGGIRKLLRGGLEVAPIPNAVRLAGRAVLGGSKSRKQITDELLSGRNLKAAQRILDDVGGSSIPDTAANLRRLGEEALLRKEAAKAAPGTRSTRAAKDPQTVLEELRAKTLANANKAGQQFLAKNAQQLAAERAAAEAEQRALEAARRQGALNAAQAGQANTQRMSSGLAAERQASAEELARLAQARQQTLQAANEAGQSANDVNVQRLLAERQAQAQAEAARGQTLSAANEAGRRANQQNTASLLAERDAANKAADGALSQAMSDDAALDEARKATLRKANEAGQRANKQRQASLQAERKAEDDKKAFEVINARAAGERTTYGDKSAMGVTIQRFAELGLEPQDTINLINKMKGDVGPDYQKLLEGLLSSNERVPGLLRLQDDILDYAKKIGMQLKEQPKGTGTGVFNNVDAEGNPIRSNTLYNMGKESRQGLYKEAKASVKDLGLSDKAEKAVKEAISDLQTGSPKEPVKVLTQVQERLSKLSPEERAKAEPLVDALIDRFYTDK